MGTMSRETRRRVAMGQESGRFGVEGLSGIHQRQEEIRQRKKALYLDPLFLNLCLSTVLFETTYS